MSETFVAVLTGEGLGAVAVVYVWGEQAITVVDKAFRANVGLRFGESLPGRPRLGRLGSGEGDEVVAMIVPNESGNVEVHCHGGPAAVALVVDGLVEAGAEPAPSACWLRRSAGLRLQSEARQDLPLALTLKTASHLLDQMNGALDRELEGIRDILCDFPDVARARIDRLIASASIGVRLVSGWRVVLAGRPNVGKSRLLNALAGFDRAIVDSTPGTTRDIVSVRTAIDGWPVELSDTAGLRKTDDPIEAAGVHLAQTHQQVADVVLLVLDQSEPLTEDDSRLMTELPAALVVANKIDLPAAWTFDGLSVSAEQGKGIDRLIAEIGSRLVPDPPLEGAPLPFRDRHIRRLHLIRSALDQRKEEWGLKVLRRWLRSTSQ